MGFFCCKRSTFDLQPAPLPACHSSAFAANCAQAEQRFPGAAEEHHAKRRREDGRSITLLPLSEVAVI
jgi:hypothetical protein